MIRLLPLLLIIMCSAAEVDQVDRVSSYIEQHASDKIDAEHVAGLLVDAVTRTAGDGCTELPDPLLLACIARYESSFKVTASNGTCRGLLQIHRCHRGSMADMGLDYDIEADRLSYGCWLYSRRGLKPWTTRKLATRDYKEATKDE